MKSNNPIEPWRLVKLNYGLARGGDADAKLKVKEFLRGLRHENSCDIFISYRRVGGLEFARIVFLELQYRGYDVFCEYVNDKLIGNEGAMSAIRTCRYMLLLISDGIFESESVRKELRCAIDLDKEIVPLCPTGVSRGLPADLPSEFDGLKTIQVSLLQTDDLFEKSVDKIIEDRFDEEFKKDRKGCSLTANGLSLNTLRLIDTVRADGESLDACISRVFSRKIDEAHHRDWGAL